MCTLYVVASHPSLSQQRRVPWLTSCPAQRSWGGKQRPVLRSLPKLTWEHPHKGLQLGTGVLRRVTHLLWSSSHSQRRCEG